MATADAKPNWGTAETIAGIQTFRDHISSFQYYYVPASYVVSERNSVPQVYFQVYRFLDNPETLEIEEFNLAGLLTIEMKIEERAEPISQLFHQIKQRSPFALLAPLPVSGFDSRLSWVSIDVEGDEMAGAIDDISSGGVESVGSDGSGAQWERRRFSVSLPILTTELFWSGFEADGLQLDLFYEWLVDGVRQAGDGTWVDETLPFGGATPIYGNMGHYPQNFAKVDTYQIMQATHNDLVVVCYDFRQGEEKRCRFV